MWVERMGAGLCASVLTVNVIVFWLGLSGVPSSGLVEILAALTSPSLSQFDSWWDLRWNVRVWIASNIHNNLVSLLHPSPLSTPLLPLYFSTVFAPSILSFCFSKHLSYAAHTIQCSGAVPVLAFWAVVFHPGGSVLSLCHKSLDPKQYRDRRLASEQW